MDNDVKELANKFVEIADKSAYWSKSFKDIATYVHRLIEIEVLKARIEEIETSLMAVTFLSGQALDKARLESYQSKLKELQGD